MIDIQNWNIDIDIWRTFLKKKKFKYVNYNTGLRLKVLYSIL